ncbi:MAG: hypothetical protein MUC69_03620 [Gemmatimonadales bacterium]|nr:hypothetical protein [Gemmatimonadales bacterium]
MGALHAALIGASLLGTTPPDTTGPWATPATRAVVERAMARQRALDSAVTDYQALMRYRLSVSLGRRRWGRSTTAAVEEQEARVQWAAPNDVRVDVLGRRTRSLSNDLRLQSVWDRPWFVPRSLGDSVRIFSDEFPAIAPLHPLAAAGPEWYRYELVDCLALSTPDGRRLRVLQVDVTPRQNGDALLTGRLWIDAATSEVVRFAFRYVGTRLWVRPDTPTKDDSSDARRANGLISRFFSLDVDLEYALQEGQYWMPYRQTIAGRVTVPVVSDLVIPFEAVTTFRDFSINTGTRPSFSMEMPDSISADSARRLWRVRQDSVRKARDPAGELPDSLWSRDYAGRWSGGRFEMHRPPKDSLRRYEAWGDSLRLEPDPELAQRTRELEGELEGLAEGLPDAFTGRQRFAFTPERLADVLVFNRVQGPTLGVGMSIRAPWLRYTTIYPTVRYGFADQRLVGRLAVTRNTPGSKLTIAGYRDILDVDPVSPGRTVPNTVNALFTTHDNADYLLATGGSASILLPSGGRNELRFTARVEEQQSVEREARSGVNDFLGGSGEMEENPPILDGTFAGLGATWSGGGAWRWSVTTDGLVGAGTTTGRVFGEMRRAFGERRGVLLRLKAGTTTGAPPPQMQFRAGGQQTVRASPYGSQRGQSFWATMVDVTPWGGTFRPVLFADAGWAGDLDDFARERPLVGAGIGLSIYSSLLRSGLIRFDLSHQLVPGSSGVRFDVIIQAFR